MITLLILMQLFTTLFMVGMIWFVQLVHYPLFDIVGNSNDYHKQHQKRTTWIAAPVMLLEAITTIILLIERGKGVDIIGAFLLLIIWISTLLWQIPCHKKLSLQYSKSVVRRLVQTNWVRTFCWSARGILLLLQLTL